ncbi:FG-GAP repeat protein [Hymenobacter roseosalivarius DSM 11622]|uniref:FG-GAP repeat protein n=1 Tax=Hymenobacter roseosalivarius DSM 11622 TaxID=645990 RepID=A0A1W1UF11_9BACT|nr:FG-GAP-like repeat-containing protein [Hymenobacter roseosalivarius]SMB79650.1 FG-GAP repeat protein [Hymenobacter roseosalivarius DSM 11622]
MKKPLRILNRSLTPFIKQVSQRFLLTPGPGLLVGLAVLWSIFGSSPLAAQQFTLTQMTPGRHTGTVPLQTAPVLTFSNPLGTETNVGQAVRFFSAQRGGLLPGTYRPAGNTLTFTPTLPFRPGEVIQASVTTQVLNAAGAALAQGQVYQFTTAVAPALGTFAAGAFNDPVLEVEILGVAAADFNGDGIVDVATGGRSGNITVSLGDGTGRLPTSAAYFLGGAYISVTAADINGDGHLDILAPRVREGDVNILLNNGQGKFSQSARVTVAQDARAVAMADLDSDGDLDMVVAGYSGYVSIRYNNGSGQFSSNNNVDIPLNTPHGVASGDVDSDGDLDIAITSYVAGTVTILRNNGNRTFTPGPALPTGASPMSVAFGDINGDGRLDLLVANYGSAYVSVATGNNSGTFQPLQNVPVPNPADVVLGDVDGDGDLDFASNPYSGNGTSNGRGVAIRLNNGQGQFSGTQQVPLGPNYTASNSTLGCALADMNGDGTLDLVAPGTPGASSGRTIAVRLNSPTTTLSSSIDAFCGGANTGTLTLTAPYGTILRYQADNGAGFKDLPGVNTSSTYTFVDQTTSTTYRAVMLTPELREIYSNPVTVAVNPIPSPSLTLLTGNSFCGSGILTLQATQGTGYSYQYLLNGNPIPGATAARYSATVSSSGQYQVVITSSAGCSATSTPSQVYVTPIPATPTLTATTQDDGAVRLTSSAPSGSRLYAFYRNGLQVNLTTKPEYLVSDATQSGWYTVKALAVNGSCTSAASNEVQVQVTPVAITWTGAISTAWNEAGNWSAGRVPTITDRVLIPAGTLRPPVLEQEQTVAIQALRVAPGATFSLTRGALEISGPITLEGTFTQTGGQLRCTGSTAQTFMGSATSVFSDVVIGPAGVTAGGRIAVQGLLTLRGTLVSNGALLLLSTPTGTALVVNDGGAIQGNTTVQRTLDASWNPGLGDRYYSAPVASTTVADLATPGFAPVINPDFNRQGAGVTPVPTVYGYDQDRLSSTPVASQRFEQGYFSPASLTDKLVSGRGYRVNLAANNRVEFVGTLNTGTIAVGPLPRGEEVNSGWHLLGNPYPSPLDWKKVRLNLPPGVIPAVYVYTSRDQYTGTYQVYQNGFGTLPRGQIDPMQGFFIRVSQPVPAFSFLDTWRSTTFPAPAPVETRSAVELNLVSAQGAVDAAFIYFEDGASAGVDDRYDAEKLPNTTGLNLASLASGRSLAVNGLPAFTGTSVVPLAVEVPIAGTYTLEAKSVLNLGVTEVYLQDGLTGQQINLRQQPRYSFSATKAEWLKDRFTLRLGPLSVLASQSAVTPVSVTVFPNPAQEQFTVVLPAVSGKQLAEVQLYTLVGQRVRESQVKLGVAQTHTSVPVADLPVGVYVLRIYIGDALVTKQVVIQ